MAESTTIQDTLTIEEIRGKIAQLSVTEANEDLRPAMDDLKKALRDNPAACSALLPEDIGEMVKYLLKVTGKVIEEDLSGKKPKKEGSTAKTKAPKINLADPAVQKEIEDDLLN